MRLLMFVVGLAFATLLPIGARASTSPECQLFLLALTQPQIKGSNLSTIYLAPTTAQVFPKDLSYDKLMTPRPKPAGSGTFPHLSRLKRETFDAFVANNREQASVDCESTKEHNIVMDANPSAGEVSWYLSRAGLDHGPTQAVIYVSYYCGRQCAGGKLYVFEKQNGQWHLAESLMLWVS